jgi:hypothetical protein
MRRGAARHILVVLAAIGSTACDAVLTSVGEWSAAVQAGDASVSLYFEAESAEALSGFTVQTDATVSGGQYLAPPSTAASDDAPGSARATYSFDVPSSGNFYLWGRIHSPDANHNRFWFQIDGGAWRLWRISTGEQWWWNQAHDNAEYAPPLTFMLMAGTHQMVLADAASGVGIDRFYLTTGSETPLGNVGPCDPPHSIQLGGVCVPSCGSQGGNGCGSVQCAGRATLSAYDCDICCVVPVDQ